MTSPSSIDHQDETTTVITQHRGSASVNLSGRTMLMVWSMSLLFHIIGLMLMFALAFPYRAERVDAAPPTTRATLLGALDDSPYDTANPHQADLPVPTDTPLVRFSPQPQSPQLQARSTGKSDLSIIGIGAGGGDFSELGFSIRDQAGPEFFGLGSSARGVRKVVYVVDRSASMIDTSIYVREELKRSVSALRRSQKFHIIFFNSGIPLEFSPNKLVNAITARKQQAYKFIDSVEFVGATRPESAMRRAFAMKPDLIYLLSDGLLSDSLEATPRFMRMLDEWNPDRTVRMFTIAYLDRAGSDLLKAVAREHGGEFKFVSENDLP